VIPSAVQPCKPEGPTASDEIRWEMVQAVTSEDPMFEPSRIELDRKGISYTIDTLEILIKDYPKEDHELFWLSGIDAALEITEWRNPARILELAVFIIMQRHGFEQVELPEPWSKHMKIVGTPIIEISSTMIRQRVGDGLPVRLLVGNKVDDLIHKHKLYTD